MNQAECAAIRFGVRAFQDTNWDRLEDEREMPAADPQLDLEEPRLALAVPEPGALTRVVAGAPKPSTVDKWKRRQ